MSDTPKTYREQIASEFAELTETMREARTRAMGGLTDEDIRRGFTQMFGEPHDFRADLERAEQRQREIDQYIGTAYTMRPRIPEPNSATKRLHAAAIKVGSYVAADEGIPRDVVWDLIRAAVEFEREGR